jgi:hypothetical protein
LPTTEDKGPVCIGVTADCLDADRIVLRRVEAHRRSIVLLDRRLALQRVACCRTAASIDGDASQTADERILRYGGDRTLVFREGE